MTKTKVPQELKNLPLDRKIEALVGSVRVDATKVADKTIVVVDDLYQSGLTINYIAEELRQAGAKEVFGLAAVKTLRDDVGLIRFRRQVGYVVSSLVSILSWAPADVTAEVPCAACA